MLYPVQKNYDMSIRDITGQEKNHYSLDFSTSGKLPPMQELKIGLLGRLLDQSEEGSEDIYQLPISVAARYSAAYDSLQGVNPYKRGSTEGY